METEQVLYRRPRLGIIHAVITEMGGWTNDRNGTIAKSVLKRYARARARG